MTCSRILASYPASDPIHRAAKLETPAYPLLATLQRLEDTLAEEQGEDGEVQDEERVCRAERSVISAYESEMQLDPPDTAPE